MGYKKHVILSEVKRSLEEDLLRIDNQIDFYERWHKAKGLRSYQERIRQKKEILKRLYVECPNCGKEFIGKKLQKSMVHVNIEQDPPLKFFCCPECKIKWSCMQL